MEARVLFSTLGAKIQGLLGLPIFSTEKEKEMQLTGDKSS